jgi:hypothetical protein
MFKELGRLKRVLASMKDTTFQSSGAWPVLLCSNLPCPALSHPILLAALPPNSYHHHCQTAYGKRENVETTIHGRVIFDLLPYMFRNHKLSSYSLNSVSAEFLGQQKEVGAWMGG